MYSKFLQFCLFLTSLLYFLVSATLIRAQEVSLSLSPPVTEFLLRPNTPVVQTFSFTVSGSDATLIPTLHRAIPLDNTGHITIDPNPLNLATIPLVVTATPPLNQPLTASHQPSLITLTFSAANTDQTQDVYLALVLQTADRSDPLSDRHLGIGGGISALLLVTLTPDGALPINLDLSDFDPPLFHDTFTNLTLSPKLDNHSPIMVRPEGTYEIISPTNRSVVSLSLYPNLILGNSSRELQLNLNGQPSPLTWSPRWSHLGPYRLRLTVQTPGGTQLIESEKIIWLFPFRITTLILVAVLLTLTLLIVRNRALTDHK